MKKSFIVPVSRRLFLASLVPIIALSCKKSAGPAPDDEGDGTPAPDKIQISGLSVPTNIVADKQTEIKIMGKGFLEGDVLVASIVTNPAVQHTINLKKLLTDQVTFQLPEALASGNYRIALKRGTDTSLLGITNIDIVFNANIPDIAGMTIKGTVYAGGVGLANVVVSDGVEVTKTNSDGTYHLPSVKNNGYVFVSFPGNYDVKTDRSRPQYFKTLTQTATNIEIKDFELIATNNNKHVVLAMTDLHLARRTNDLSQFELGFLKDAKTTIKAHRDAGTKVYGLTMGDLTWETYWYTPANNFRLGDYLNQMDKLEIPVFNCMGNHDNDPYETGDINTASTYKRIVGPTYYSFNLGKVHYIVLDNVEYLNRGGAQGVIGDRYYDEKISANQIEWLKKDLAMIEDKSTPIIVAMHVQLNNNPSLSGSGQQTSSFRLDNSSQFVAAVNGFSNVNVLTGHTHLNYNVENSVALMEHNTAAVCATWWWTGNTGYAGNHICKDGTPGGYGVWEFNDKDVKWQYKGIGHHKDYQFRAYDLNNCHITAAKYAPKSTDALLASFASTYVTPNNNNEILINVWNFDPKWKIEVFENGAPLTVTRVRVHDPLHVISYAALRLNAGATPTADFTSTLTAHMFRAKASNATNTLLIKVTDRFGRVYTENMERPKALTYLMT